MPLMATVAAGDFAAGVEGFTAGVEGFTAAGSMVSTGSMAVGPTAEHFMVAGSTMPLGISAPGSGSEASTHRIGGVTPIPTTTITTTILSLGITATIPATITATIPTMTTARSPTPGRPGTIAPPPLAIIHM